MQTATKPLTAERLEKLLAPLTAKQLANRKAQVNKLSKVMANGKLSHARRLSMTLAAKKSPPFSNSTKVTD
jgi:hypothetical protein